MTLSKKIKSEIIKKNLYKKETKSFLQGIFIAAGSLVISNGNVSFTISSDLQDVVSFVIKRLNEIFPETQLDVSRVVRSFKNKERYEIFPVGSGLEILKGLGVVFTDKNGDTQISDDCDKEYYKNEQEMKAFLTGVFLGSGGLSAPEAEGKRSHGYHFEIDVQTKNQADVICELFSNFDIFPKSVARGEEFVVYLKNSETICDALSLFGASKIVLDLMNKKIDRDMNNMTNRQVNCISANLDKTVNAALRQLKAIEVIQNTVGLENLPENLCETALLRLSNPEASLSDLLPLMEKKISKGALAQRFDKIIKLAEELGEEDE